MEDVNDDNLSFIRGSAATRNISHYTALSRNEEFGSLSQGSQFFVLSVRAGQVLYYQALCLVPGYVNCRGKLNLWVAVRGIVILNSGYGCIDNTHKERRLRNAKIISGIRGISCLIVLKS